MSMLPLLLILALARNGGAKKAPPSWPGPRHPPPRTPKPSAPIPPAPPPPQTQAWEAPPAPPAPPKRKRRRKPKAAPFVPQNVVPRVPPEVMTAARTEPTPASDARAGAIMLRDFLRANPARHGHRNDRPPEVVAAQRAMGLPPDGIVGPNTRARAAALGVKLPVRGARNVAGALYIP